MKLAANLAQLVCTYVENGRPCRLPPAGELRAHMAQRKDPWPMCERHLDPEMHPPGLRERLYRYAGTVSP